MGAFALIAIILIIFVIVNGVLKERTESKMTADERKNHEDILNTQMWGLISSEYICPHCRKKGFVSTMPVKRKKGISGAKATGALLTAGVSILATGLARKEGLTQAHCGNCNSTWDF
jgi:hypothetical protein